MYRGWKICSPSIVFGHPRGTEGRGFSQEPKLPVRRHCGRRQPVSSLSLRVHKEIDNREQRMSASDPKAKWYSSPSSVGRASNFRHSPAFRPPAWQATASERRAGRLTEAQRALSRPICVKPWRSATVVTSVSSPERQSSLWTRRGIVCLRNSINRASFRRTEHSPGGVRPRLSSRGARMSRAIHSRCSGSAPLVPAQ